MYGFDTTRFGADEKPKVLNISIKSLEYFIVIKKVGFFSASIAPAPLYNSAVY